MVNARPTVERRQLGLALKRLRERSELSQLAAGQHIGKDDSRISKIEDGLATPKAEDLVKLLELYGVVGNERETIVALGAVARKRQPARAYIDLLPDSFQRFGDLEAAASKIRSYEAGVVPGLLQSHGYIDALFASSDNVWWAPSEDRRRNMAEFRRRRQEVTWQAKEKELHFVIGEAALDEVNGSTEVMRGQLRHLLDLIDSKPNLMIQMLPKTVPNNPARGGGLTVFEFGISLPRIGFALVVTGPSTYVDDSEDTANMLRALYRLSELSLTPEETRAAITQKLETL
ncbi:helix-turn-helix domain-containing protein [Actinokineospora pegani]|uniref:helix-turn-helix domain-containing protein n=1 Tax=Actinokineospora pegani TaxID=2654637 RepID=UPI0018D3614E|nr:helix-turn-helix transcriptional regulator [Actinokineospora pegani]